MLKLNESLIPETSAHLNPCLKGHQVHARPPQSKQSTLLYSWKFFPISVRSHWLESNLSNSDTEGTDQSVRIREVSV